MKVILFFACIPLLLFLVDSLTEFQLYADEKGLQTFLDHLSADTLQSLRKYIGTEYIFFGTAAIISAIIFPIRLLVSVWRVRNRGTV